MDSDRWIPDFFLLKDDTEKLEKILYHYTNGTLAQVLTVHREDIENWKGGISNDTDKISVRRTRSMETDYKARAM